jgi:eight-cysteine-cluster-containing protein
MMVRWMMIAVLGVALVGCTDDEADELGEFPEETGEDDLGKADDASGNHGYYAVRFDTRKCSYPLCGGYFVKRLNRTSMRCDDGTSAPECYVATLDTDALGLGGEALGALDDALRSGGVAVLRGTLGSVELDGFGRWGSLVASEAWLAGSEAIAIGAFTRVSNSGIVCITTPCPTMIEGKLNSSLETLIADLDLRPTGASAESLNRAFEAIDSDDGLLVAGYRYTTSGPAGRAKARRVHQFFTRLADVAVSTDCVVGGCSGQICADEPMFSTCEWRDEYACYADASCERQSDGRCGWTPSGDLAKCLRDHRP